MNKNKIVCLIPARLHSTRFPEKILYTIQGKPLLEWVYRAACSIFSEVWIAYDDEKTKHAALSFTDRLLATSVNCSNGTMRIIDAIDRYNLEGDIFVNWQADEPLIHQEMIDDLMRYSDAHIDIWTLKKKIMNEEDLVNPNIVKVVTDKWQNALYFSRSPIPYKRGEGLVDHYKHIGLYAYTKSALERIKDFTPCALEKAEVLEQLTFLYNGLKISVQPTMHESHGIDILEDVLTIEEKLLNNEFCRIIS